jgi:hypothetical protein
VSSQEDDDEDDQDRAGRGAPVPYDRFKRVNAERRAAATRATQAEQRAAALEAELAKEREQRSSLEARTRRMEARADTGIDDDHDLGAVIGAYDRATADDKKKPGLKAWLTSLAADEAEAGKHLPASLRTAYLARFRPQEPPARGGRQQAPPPARSPITSTVASAAPAVDVRDRRQVAAAMREWRR